MSINLDELLAQRAEATGVEGDRVPFEFGGKTFSFLDPMLMTDEQRDDMAELDHDVDVAVFYMGEDQYDEFTATKAKVGSSEVHGSAGVFLMAFQEYMTNAQQTDDAGRPTQSNRSSRRAAERKRRKQR